MAWSEAAREAALLARRARMEQREKVGVPPVVYHGSPVRGLTRLQPGAGESGRPLTGPKGIYATSDPRAAASYAINRTPGPMKNKFGAVYPVHLRMNNPLDITKPMAKLQKQGLSFRDAKAEALKKLTPQNDGVVFRGNRLNSPEYVVFKPSQARIVQPSGDSLHRGAAAMASMPHGKKG